jgi:hypothetical protein
MPPPADCGPEDGETCGDKFGCVEEIFVANPDGSHARQVTSDSSGQSCSTDPSWSPDGTRLVVERWHVSSDSTLAVLSLSTLRLRGLPLHARYVVWGKPGIAYVDNIGVISLLNPDTGVSKPIATDSATSLAWSSRGELAATEGKRIIIFSSNGRRLEEFVAPTPGATTGEGLA